MTTFLDLQNRVRARVIDIPTAVGAQIPNLINDAIKEMQREYNYRAMEASVSMVTTEGSLIPTPNTIENFKEYRDKGPYMLQYLTKAKRYITISAPDAAMAALADANLPEEPAFLLNSVDVDTGITNFTIHPYPDALSDWPDGDYRIIVPHYVYTPDLSADGDQNWFTNNAADYIERKAAGEAFGLDWDYNSMALLLQEADKKLRQIRKADKLNRLSSVDTFVPMWQGANQPQVRR